MSVSESSVAVATSASTSKFIPANEFRKVQTERVTLRKEDQERRDREFAENFKVACQKYSQTLLDECAHALKVAQGRSKPYIILDDRVITEDCDGFAYTSFLYGFWDKRNHRFNDSVFTKHSIEKPLKTAQDTLAPLGYKLEDVSDPKRSRRLFLKLSW